jgi:hypothetical protein
MNQCFPTMAAMSPPSMARSITIVNCVAVARVGIGFGPIAMLKFVGAFAEWGLDCSSV